MPGKSRGREMGNVFKIKIMKMRKIKLRSSTTTHGRNRWYGTAIHTTCLCDKIGLALWLLNLRAKHISRCSFSVCTGKPCSNSVVVVAHRSMQHSLSYRRCGRTRLGRWCQRKSGHRRKAQGQTAYYCYKKFHIVNVVVESRSRGFCQWR